MSRSLGSINPGNLPSTLSTRETADLLGISADHLWALTREGTPPVEPLRLGRTYRWPTVRVLALLGIDAAPTPPAGSADADVFASLEARANTLSRATDLN